MNFTRKLLMLLLLLASTFAGRAQVSLTATGGTTSGSYTTLNAAFAAIDSGTHTGAISISITGNTTEPTVGSAASAVLNASGTGNASYSAVTVTPSGGNWTVTGAATAGSALIDFNGADNVTINGGNNLTIVNTTVSATSGTSTIRFTNDATGNTINSTTILGGFTGSAATNGGTIYFATNNATLALGNDNNTISGCNLGPVSSSSLPTKAVFSNGTTTTTASNNSGCVITGNNIYDYFGAAVTSGGIYLSSGTTDWTISNNKFYQTAGRTQTTGGQHSAIWISNSSGNNFQITGNTIGYASASATGVYTLTGVASTVFVPIYMNVGTTTATSVQGNTITAIAMSGAMSGTTSSAPMRLIYVSAGLTNVGNVTGNILGSLSATGAITYTSSSASTSEIYPIYNVGSSAWTVSNNLIGGITGANSSTGSICIFPIRANTLTSVTFTCQNNTIGGTVANSIQSTSTASSSSVQGIQIFNGIGTVTGNIIRNMSTAGGTGTTSSASVAGIMTSSSSAETISGNTISNLSSSGASANIIGIAIAGGTTVNVNGNTMNTFSGTGATSPLIAGVQVSAGTTVNVYKNKIYDFTESGAISTTAGAVNGIQFTSGTTVSAYNNLIGDLKTPAANLADAIRGIAVTSSSTSTNYNVYYNSLYLNAASTGTNFGSTGIYHTGSSTASTATLDLRNNIVINTSTPNGTGITAAFRRSSASLANYASTSNRNLLYAGTPGALKLIMYDGTNSYQTMATYQTAVSTRDVNSFGGETTFDYAGGATQFFISTAGANANYLAPVAGITTQVESGAASVTGVTDDYNGVTRPASGTNPDLGAWEFAGVTPVPVITFNSITPGTTPQCSATARVINVNVTSAGGALSGVVLNYNNGSAGSTPMTLVSGSTYTATIPAAIPVNAAVTWSVTAVATGISATYTGTGYQDAPLTGLTPTATVSASTICAGNNDTLTALLTSNDTAAIGSGATTSTSAASDPFYGGYGGVKTQYIIKASELSAAGFIAGPVTSVGINITAAGSTLSGFAVNIDTTSLSVMTGTILNVNTNVYSTASFVPVNGVNTFNFGTPYTWDGVSNLVLSFCWSNNNTSNTASTVTVYSPGFTASCARYVDSRTSAEVCSYTGSATPTGWNGASTTTSSRPVFVWGGFKKKSNITVVWSNGTSAVGTSNPQVVNPTATTTYNAAVTYTGCTTTTNNVTVTTNPLPAAPAGTNSVQCGTQVPTASATDPNGYTMPTYKWYAASTGGVALQSSTSATYTAAIATTTTFYVSVVNPATGCESGRTAVTVTVSSPDAVTAKANSVAGNTGSCLNSSINLSSVQTGTTNNYAYTWTASPAAGSGIATSMTGQNVTVTPTAAGIYTYTVTAVDGSCTTTSTVIDTVKNPFANVSVVASASPVTTCSGASDTLKLALLNPGNAVVGAGAGTATSYDNPFFSSWSNTQQQILVKASELSAAGLTAGNITGLSLQITSGTTIMPDFNIGIQNTAASALSTLTTSGFTSVYANATGLTPVIGTNTITFSTPYYWDGASNLLLKFCWGNSSTTATQSSTAVADATSYVCGVNAHNTSASSGSTICGSSTVYSTYSNRPKFTFYGNTAPAAGSVIWSNGSTAVGTTNPLVVNPVVNTTYTGTAMLSGCTAVSSPVSVTISPLSAATASVTSAVICAGKSDTLSVAVTGSGTPFSYSWSDGSTVIGTTQTLVVSPASTKTYTVTVTNTCNETATAGKTITVNPLPALSASGNSPVCTGNTLNLTATSNGASFAWSGPNGFSSSAQNPSVNNVTAAAAGTYTVTAVSVAGCSSAPATTAVVVNNTPSAVTVTPASSTMCAGNIQQFTASGGAVTGYAILAENFNTPTNSWTATNSSTGGTTPAGAAWLLKPYPYSYSTSVFKSNDSSQFYMTNSDTAGSGNVTNTMLQSPAFSTVGATNVYVDFYHHYKPWTSAANDSATVEASSDGTTWVPVKVFKATASGASNAFAHDTAYLTAFSGMPAVYVRYHFTSTYGYWWAVDNVTVRGTVQSPLTWAPVSGLYTDAGTTVAYTAGANAATVYAKPTATATYTASATSPAGCTAVNTATVTVNPLPNAAVSGTSSVCVNGSVALTPATAGGTWVSVNPVIATVNSSGVVTGVAAGTDTIRYKVTNVSGCTDSSFKVVTVNALPNVVISGAAAVCVNSSITLTPGSAGGTWSSANTSIATVNSSGVVTGISAGATTVKYVNSNANGCTDSTTKTITVNALPNVAITGATAVCVNSSITLTPGSTGGSWTSSNTAVATVNSSGVVMGISAGTATIKYINSNANGCMDSAAKAVTVNALPLASLSGAASLCVNATATMTPATSGGVFTSTNPAIATVNSTGVVTGIAAGTDTIRYKLTNASGCTDSSLKVITINALPNVAITGATAVCVNSSITLTPGSTGGNWTSSNTAVATVSSSGVVTGVSAGTATIKYVNTNGSGCTDSATKAVTVNALPLASLSGAASLCVNATATMTPATSGGVFTSTNPAIATVNSAGIVTGVSAGTDTIRYKLTNASGCTDSSFKVITINALPNVAITGATAVCVNSSITLTPGSTGGSWTSSNTAVATVNSSGVVTGISAGTATIKYINSNTNGCMDSATKAVTVNALPLVSLNGATSLCVNATATMTPATSGGVFTSGNPAIATVNSAGVVTGIAAGTDTIRYKLTNASGCTDSSFKVITINALPNVAITGATAVCVNSSITLTGTGTGSSIWTSSNTSIATVSSAGVVTGIATGTDTITYTLTNANGCVNAATKVVTVNALPNAAISGASGTCVNSSVTLTPATSGGVWSSSNTAIATVNNTTGVVTGVAAGTDTITYTVTNANGCISSSTKVFTVGVLPSVSISGNAAVCVHAADTLTGLAAGGAWMSSNPSVATVSNTGIVTGISAGTDTITYTVINGCSNSAVKVITVNPLPAINVTAGGPVIFCDGDSVLLTAHTTATNYLWFKDAAATSVTDSVYNVQSGGNYHVLVSNSFGCVDTSAGIVVTDHPLPQPVITASGDTMSTTIFTTYQWYRNDTLINGATTNTYIATQNGSYTVAVTDTSSCTGISAALNMAHVGIIEPGKVKDIRVYPNPSKGMVYFDSPGPVNVTIYAADGRKIAYSDQVKSINMTAYAAGTYTFVITDKEGSFRVVKRIVKAD
ncbi:Ig-like domain-containing protein [Chitinophagaceae bacterium MMS25-I14]